MSSTCPTRTFVDVCIRRKMADRKADTRVSNARGTIEMVIERLIRDLQILGIVALDSRNVPALGHCND